MHKQLTNIIIANQSAMDAVFAVVLVVGTYYQPDPTKILVKGNVADEILCRVWYLKTPLWGMLISTTYGIVLLTIRQVPGSCLSDCLQNQNREK